MPVASVGGLEMYYELHGSGEPLVLVEGLGYSRWMWFKQVPAFSRHFLTVVFDNRGVGRTSKPDHPYTIRMMADDLAGLLGELGLRGAHVLGVSMGGFIAQELAINYPEMVKGLVLACTSFGGSRSLPMPEETLRAITEVEGLSREEVIRRGLATGLTASYLERKREEFERMVTWRLEEPVPRYAWLRQFEACQAFDASGRVGAIRAPTLVITGDQDRVIPAGNSRLLAEAIPGARLATVKEAGHLFFIERAAEFNRLVKDFLEEDF